ncbi:MAG TPA: alpha/beta fold hydrolase [Pyrinomonadaceae bacterium]|nr:alpha/beta fold hydrolase [Pyrinomonadaceae bacterium]
MGNKHEPHLSAEAAARAFLAEVGRLFEAKRFNPHRVFKGGHAQTLAAYAWPRRFRVPADEERLFEVEAGVRVLAHCRWQNDPQACPTIVLWHGIEGSTASIYMIATADKAFRAGFNVVRVNYRNCGGTEHLTPTLYHGGMSGDVHAVISELISRDGLTQIFPVGYSLGGNLVLKLAAEYGQLPPREVSAVCAISPSVNLRASSELISQRSNWIYQQDFVRRLKRRVIVKQKLHPGLYDLSKLRLVRTLKDFDDYFTATAHGFADAHDYYEKASSIHLIDRIRIPSLIIHAQDDPFIPFAPLRNPAVEANPFILLLGTERGGHVAFIAADRDQDEDRFWAENRAVEFCKLASSSTDFADYAD